MIYVPRPEYQVVTILVLYFIRANEGYERIFFNGTVSQDFCKSAFAGHKLFFSSFSIIFL